MKTSMKTLLIALAHDESGQDLIEYALVAAVIALGAVSSLQSLALAVSNGLNSVGTALSTAV